MYWKEQYPTGRCRPFVKGAKREDKEVIVKEAITTTSWIYRLIKEICES